MIRALIDRVWLRLLLRNEYDSVPLRTMFAQRFHVEVGLYSYGCFDRWRVPPRTRIGRYCSFATSARIIDANHPIEAITTHPFLYEAKFGIVPTDLIDPPWLEIGDDVWIGHNATITSGCKSIGRGAIIGAGAIVTRNVPAYAVMAGVPARKLRWRFDPEVIAAVEKSHWWELDKSALAALVAGSPDALFKPNSSNLESLFR